VKAGRYWALWVLAPSLDRVGWNLSIITRLEGLDLGDALVDLGTCGVEMAPTPQADRACLDGRGDHVVS
jgi:hypothetical protein